MFDKDSTKDMQLPNPELRHCNNLSFFAPNFVIGVLSVDFNVSKELEETSLYDFDKRALIKNGASSM